MKAPDAEAEFTIDPVQVTESYGFDKATLGRIRDAIERNIVMIKEAWDDYQD